MQVTIDAHVFEDEKMTAHWAVIGAVGVICFGGATSPMTETFFPRLIAKPVPTSYRPTAQ
jgi:hypothetical protein